MFLMSLAFFGKGFGALGWTVIPDTSPKELIGLNGGPCNLFGNIAGITTPPAIGYLVKKSGSYNTRHSSSSVLRRCWRFSAKGKLLGRSDDLNLVFIH